jgi:hypothetical protein
LAALAAAILAGACGPSGMQATSGVVIDTTTEQPLADVVVTLECERSTGFHSSEAAGSVVVRTDAAGRYVFERNQVAGCDTGRVTAAKAGYVDSGTLGVRYAAFAGYGRIPRSLYLTPERDAGMLRLTLLEPGPRLRLYPAGQVPSGTEPVPEPNEPAADEYDRVFEAFYKSKWIARTDAEKRHVLEHYCRRLDELQARIPADQRAARPAALASYEEIDGERRIAHLAPRDHATEVVTFCRSGGAARSLYTYRFPSSTACTTILRDPVRIRNHVCRSPVHVVLAFNDQGIGVESADVAPGEEYRTRTQAVPRIAECAEGEIPVTARGVPWTGVENAALCRAELK